MPFQKHALKIGLINFDELQETELIFDFETENFAIKFIKSLCIFHGNDKRAIYSYSVNWLLAIGVFFSLSVEMLVLSVLIWTWSSYWFSSLEMYDKWQWYCITHSKHFHLNIAYKKTLEWFILPLIFARSKVYTWHSSIYVSWYPKPEFIFRQKYTQNHNQPGTHTDVNNNSVESQPK